MISYIKTSALDYSSSTGTWSCRGGSRVDLHGNTEANVLERAHISFSIKSITGRYSLKDRSIQLDESKILPEDQWSASGAAIIEGEVYLLEHPGSPPPICNLRLIKGPLQFIILEPETEDDEYLTAVNIPSRLKVSYLRTDVPIPKECYASIGQHRRVYPTNYQDILLLVEDETSGSLPDVTLAEEMTEVHQQLQQRSHLDFLEWLTSMRLGDLSSEVRKSRCLQSLVDNFSLCSRKQPGWRVISRGDVLIMVKCTSVVVRPLLTSPECSEQLLVQDEDGHNWRLHAGNRLLTDHGVQVPCDLLQPHYTFLTQEGLYVQQKPDLETIVFNFTFRPSSLPSFLLLEEDKILLPQEDPFQYPGGLYTVEEIASSEESYLREWSIITGTHPEALLTPKDPSPPASAASSAHQQVFPKTSGVALRGIEDFVHGLAAWGLGRLLTKFKFLALSIMLTAGNLYGCVMLLNKLISTCIHICGCCGSSSAQSWKEVICWDFCPTCTLAAKARKRFQHSSSTTPPTPPPPQPSAPPTEGDVGGAPESVPDRQFSPLNKWKNRKNRKKLATPPAPTSIPGSRRDPCEAVPLLQPVTPPSTAPGAKKGSEQETGHSSATRTSSRPPAPRRSQSTPRRTYSRREEAEVAKVLYRKT